MPIAAPNPSTLGIEQLLLRLRPLRRVLRAAADRQTAIAGRLARPGLAAMCVTPEQVDDLLDALDLGDTYDGPVSTSDELAAERELRDRSAARGVSLALDALSAALGLDAIEE